MSKTDYTEEDVLKFLKSLPKESRDNLLQEVVDKDELKDGKDKVTVDLFSVNKTGSKINELMHAADLFEPGKILANHDQIIVEGKPNLEKLCENLRAAWEEQGGYVVFAGINSINGIKSKGHPVYFKEEVQSLSMVQNNDLGWGLFKEILEKLGYEVETDQTMHVTKVT